MANWLDKYEQGGLVLKKKTKDNYGKQSNYNDAKASVGPDFVGLGYNTKGRDYSPAWGGQFAMGGALPGAVGFTYARTQSPAPSNGKYAKKTKASAQYGASLPMIEDVGDFKEGVWVPNWKAMAEQAKKLGVKKVKTKHGNIIQFNDKWEAISVDDNPKAQNGQEMKFYQEGLDFKPKTISQDGSEIPVDSMGYWNPENVGNPVIIPSNDITMEGVDQPLIGISDTGDVQYMMPGEDYEFDGEYVTEYPVAKKGISVNNADAQPIKKLDQSLNFTNYNKPTKGGWLDKYN
jgi:hypothetical protein